MEVNNFPIEHFYESEGEETIRDARFRLGVYRRAFRLVNIQDAPDAEELLLALFTHLIAIAQSDGEALHYSCIIRSPGLLRHPIQIPYRRFDQNTPQAILNEFKARQESAKDVDLLDGPLYVEMVTGPLMPDGGEGAGRPRRLFEANINKNNLIWVENHDNYCLFHAAELTRRHLEAKEWAKSETEQVRRLITGRSGYWMHKRQEMVEELFEDMRATPRLPRIPRNLDAYSIERHLPVLDRYYRLKYRARYRIVVYDQYCNPKPLYKSPHRAKEAICLLLKDGHFHGIRNLNRFIGANRYFCIDCEKTYNTKRDHKASCKAKCTRCCRVGLGPCPRDVYGYERLCAECNKSFYSKGCYERHKKGHICEYFKRCPDCGVVYNAKTKTYKHICTNRMCRRCHGYHEISGECHVQKAKERERPENYRIVVYDFEATQDTPFNGAFKHNINFVGAHLMCTLCIKSEEWDEDTIDNCAICGGVGTERKRYWSAADCENPLAEFMDWLLHLPDKYVTYALAHYAGKYDMHFVLGDIYEQGGITPHVVKKGEKLYQITVHKRQGHVAKTVFRDTYNWMPIKLEEAPKALGLDVEDKGFFPHTYNTNANLHTRLLTLPDAEEYYGRRHMKQKKADAFDRWYAENVDTEFCLKEALEEYCMNDVAILAHAVVKFRALFSTVTSKDIVQESITIAGACIDYFIERYMKPGEVAIIPDHGYNKRDKQSTKALKFLKWMAFRYEMDVQHRDSSYRGEHRLPNGWKLDGYVKSREVGQPDTAIEFNGCAWHGHECCYSDDALMCPNGKTAAKSREELAAREAYIRDVCGMELQAYWECDVDAMLKRDEEMRRFYDDCRDSGPLNPSDAYFGGRTGPLALKCDLEEDGEVEEYEIRCLDIVSLYPYINYTAEYPLGHGEPREVHGTTDIRHPYQNPYKGLIKCLIVPPTDLLVPVIPHRYNGKLMFPLCDRCARESEWRSRRRDKPASQIKREVLCPHNGPEQRAFVTTLTHLELNLALEKGYRVIYVYSVVTWKRWSADLFKGYIRDFLKLKVEASGWPADCRDSEEARRLFVERWKERWGVDIDPEAVEDNPGLKYIAKICLNSMWGRWSLRNDLSDDLLATRPMELWNIINDRTVEMGAIKCIKPGALYYVNYRKKSDFVQSHPKYNVVLSLFTTSAARIHLYKFMEMVVNSPGCKLLYTDTDSAMFKTPRGRCPIEIGEMLGEMSDVYPDHEVRAMYSPACKTYALRLVNKSDGSVKEVVKAKGFTLSLEAAERIHYQSLKRTVDNFGDGSTVAVPGILFKPSSLEGHVVTHRIEKLFRGVYDKSLVDSRLNCYPFGYHGPYTLQ